MDYNKYLAKSAKEIKPSGIRKFFDVASTMKGAISLGVGEPDFDTPWNGRSGAINSIRKGYTHYTANRGNVGLRELISRYYRERYNIDYDASTEIIVTVGASEAVDIALRAIIDIGDEALIIDPSFVSYAPCVMLAGGVPVPLECTADSDFIVTPERLESAITDKTKLLVLSYPNNPTGAIMTRKDYEKIAPIIIKHDLIVISDEIYSELTYGAKHCSVAEIEGMKERTIVINGFSKSFAMTGWRLGYSLAPSELSAVMVKIHQYAVMCAPTAAQFSAEACLQDCFQNDFAVIKEMRDEYERRKRYLVTELNEMGLKCFEPKGAFYVFADVSAFGMNGQEFANNLLKEQLVAVVPGDAFGKSGENFVRISYAYSIRDLEKALFRIKKYVDGLKVII